MLKLVLVVTLAGVCLADNVEIVRQNFEQKINSKIVQQINYELQASYMYQAYGHYFSRADVALPGFAKWFEKASNEERDHAKGLIDYINKRGGSVSLADVNYNEVCSLITRNMASVFDDRTVACICYFMSHKKDKLKSGECNGDRMAWQNGLWAMEDTLVLERFVNQELLNLHSEAANDPHLSHVLEHDYLEEQVNAIKGVSDYIRQLKRVGPGLGEYTFDKNLE